VDLWGAALVLYEIIGNQRTFQASNTEQLQQAVRHGQIQPLEELRKDLPSGLAHVLRRALNRDPEKRYQTAAEFSDALKPFHDEMVGEASASPAWCAACSSSDAREGSARPAVRTGAGPGDDVRQQRGDRVDVGGGGAAPEREADGAAGQRRG